MLKTDIHMEVSDGGIDSAYLREMYGHFCKAGLMSAINTSMLMERQPESLGHSIGPFAMMKLKSPGLYSDTRHKEAFKTW
jgi:hypothetical protein